MNSARVANFLATIAIIVLIIHAGRALFSQRRWVTAVIEILAAVVMAWQLYWLVRYQERLSASSQPQAPTR